MDLPLRHAIEELDGRVLCPECKTATQKKTPPSPPDTFKDGEYYRGLHGTAFCKNPACRLCEDQTLITWEYMADKNQPSQG